MANLNAKAVIKADFHITEITDDGAMSFELIESESIIMKANLIQRDLCQKAIDAKLMEIVHKGADKVKWEIGTVYQYLAIVQFVDDCVCHRHNCTVEYSVLEDRMRTYGYNDSINILECAKRQGDEGMCTVVEGNVGFDDVDLLVGHPGDVA